MEGLDPRKDRQACGQGRTEGKLVKISILSPVFNEEQHIAEMINSVQGQSYTDWELIFVDDGSTDRTVEIIRRHAADDVRIQIPSYGLKLGKSAAYNRAFAECSGEVVVLLAGDDRLPPASLEIRARDMEGIQNNELRLSSYKLKSFSDDPHFNGMVLPRGKDSVSFSGGVLTMSRGLADILFPIDESLPSEDIWLGYAAPAVATRVVRHPEVVLHYRIHPGNSNPRQANFRAMSEGMAARHEAWLSLQASDLPLDESARAKLAALWEAEQQRRSGQYFALLRNNGLGIAERLGLLAMAHPALYAIRKRFYRLLSGRQGR